MERIETPSNYPPSVGKFRPEQIAQRSTWAGVPDAQAAQASMHVIHVRPFGASTETVVNPLDPNTVADTADGPGYLNPPWFRDQLPKVRAVRG